MSRTAYVSKSPQGPMAILLLASLIASSAIAQQNDIVSIGFSSRMSDAAVFDLLESHNATPSKIYISASGFSGSHASRDAAMDRVNSEVFIQQARKETIGFFENALRGNTHRMHTLVEANEKEDLIQNQTLNSNLRSLLKFRAQFENVLHAAANGSPIIYAVDVKVKSRDLGKLRAHPAVRVVAVQDRSQPRDQASQDLRPSDVTSEYEADETSALTNEEVFAKVISLVDLSRPPVQGDRPGLARP